MHNSELNIQKKYLRRAKIIATILSFTPYVRMIGLSGSLARGKATEKSDIDFLVVTKQGRFWTGRAFTMVLTHLTGFHRYGKKIAGRICLNTFQSDQYLTVGPKNEKNAKDYCHLIVLFQADSLGKKFFLDNKWIIEKGLRFRNKKNLPELKIIPSIIRFIFEAIYDLFINDWGERRLRNYQIKRILADPRTQSAGSGQIYISDQELRFHPQKWGLDKKLK